MTKETGKPPLTLSEFIAGIGPPPIDGEVLWIDDKEGMVYTKDGRAFVAVFTDDGLLLDEIAAGTQVLFVKHGGEGRVCTIPAEDRDLLRKMVPELSKDFARAETRMTAARRGIRVVR